MKALQLSSSNFWRNLPPSAIPTKAEPHPHFVAAMNAVASARQRPLDVVDLGCGDGRFTLSLARRPGPWAAAMGRPLVRQVVGVDINAASIAQAAAIAV